MNLTNLTVYTNEKKITGLEFWENNILVVSPINSVSVKEQITHNNNKKDITCKQILLRI